jgi:methionyl-tRNA formyltransferase
VLAADGAGVLVACGEGALRVGELQRAGGRRLAAAEFLRGCPIRAGERLGAAR